MFFAFCSVCSVLGHFAVFCSFGLNMFWCLFGSSIVLWCFVGHVVAGFSMGVLVEFLMSSSLSFPWALLLQKKRSY